MTQTQPRDRGARVSECVNQGEQNSVLLVGWWGGVSASTRGEALVGQSAVSIRGSCRAFRETPGQRQWTQWAVSHCLLTVSVAPTHDSVPSTGSTGPGAGRAD